MIAAWILFRRTILATFLFVSLIFTMASSQTQKVLHNFGASGDGAAPQAALAIDSHGNLFGTTDAGGLGNCGIVFEMSPAGGGNWTETILDTFQNGLCRSYAPVALDGQGNIYGTTLFSPQGSGSVFELSPVGDHWVETLLHNFDTAGDGIEPESGVTLDNAGHLYGTTLQGGAYGFGMVYAVTLQPSPSYTILKSFQVPGPTLFYGWYPDGSLWVDSSGNLFGVTEAGGRYQEGTIFKLAPGAIQWVESPLYSFKGFRHQDGSEPFYGLIADSQGNLYGTTSSGGSGECNGGCGVVFRLSHDGNGGWTEKVLYAFQGGIDGEAPFCNVTFDSAGNLYGTTYAGGYRPGYFGFGTVFKLTPQAGDQWTETVLHRFSGGLDGAAPNGGVVIDSVGNLYGTTQLGGTLNLGTVWEVTP